MDTQDFVGVVLCGGRGKRMGHLTLDCPKPLIKFKGRPLIDYSIEALETAKCREIYLATGYLEEIVKDQYQSAKFISFNWRYNIYYVIINTLLQLRENGHSTVIFCDGDSVLESNSVSECLIAWNSLENPTALWFASSRCNNSSNWKLLTDQTERVQKVMQGTTENSRMFAVLSIAQCLDIFSKLGFLNSICNHAFEDQFLPDFERFYLGWGLFFNILVEANNEVFFKKSKQPMTNVNLPDDLQ